MYNDEVKQGARNPDAASIIKYLFIFAARRPMSAIVRRLERLGYGALGGKHVSVKANVGLRGQNRLITAGKPTTAQTVSIAIESVPLPAEGILVLRNGYFISDYT